MTPRFLLLQIREADDPIRAQEVGCFCRAIGCDRQYLETFDLLAAAPDESDFSRGDIVLIGGSGDYSAAVDSPWLDRTLASLRVLLELRKPTFASCWGFQAFARAAGGRCIHDPAHAELGTIELELTAGGDSDPLFGNLPARFSAQAGHEDHVVDLPPGATLLASSAQVTNQAFKFDDAPIYCTQFHPELDRTALIERLENYPRYVEQIAGMTVPEFVSQCQETRESNALLRQFVELIRAS